jgi:hypothetical protein
LALAGQRFYHFGELRFGKIPSEHSDSQGRQMSAAIVTLSQQLLARARVIARGKRIRDVARLVATYGGKSAKWVKKSSPRFEISGEQFEFHWYEHPGIGKVEVKRKQVNQP